MAKKSKKKNKNKVTNHPPQSQEMKQSEINLEEVSQMEEEKSVFLAEKEALEEQKAHYQMLEDKIRLIEEGETQYLENLREQGIAELTATKQQQTEALILFEETEKERLQQELKDSFAEEASQIQKEHQQQRELLLEKQKTIELQLDEYQASRMTEITKAVNTLKEEGQKQLDKREEAFLLKEEECHNRVRELTQKFLEEEAAYQKSIYELKQIQSQQLSKVDGLQRENSYLKESNHQDLSSLELELRDSKERYVDLSEQYRKLQEFLKQLEHDTLGISPEDYHKKIESLQTLTEELATLKETMTEYVPSTELEKWKVEVARLQNSLANSTYEDCQLLKQQLEREKGERTQEEIKNQSQEQTIQTLQGMNESLEQQLEQLRQRYCTPLHATENYQERVAQLTADFLLPEFSDTFSMDTTELHWLHDIASACEQVGMVFPLRSFYGFHTALKIADWSILTVLAGISGTGKSQLPALYALFGGIHFFSASVSSQWDSQESMLGFFNSLDNRLEPEELLKFLISSEKLTSDQEELAETAFEKSKKLGRKTTLEHHRNNQRILSLVLLDEMNLAHVEHYFSQFLSKLEERRGKEEVPSIPLQVGTALPTHPLKLHRSVLWTGTMNEDETTKSLSDKVIDRGVVIHFPRPSSFRRREAQIKQSNFASTKGLTYELWKKWQTGNTRYGRAKQEIGSNEIMEKMEGYKELLEEINEILSLEGRAFGHRVWQSLEFYVVNYPFFIYEMEEMQKEYEHPILTPNLKLAMELAVEDQIVFKIFPKFRGMEFRVGGTLDRIASLLEPEFPRLMEDYHRACHKEGYRQFMWVTSAYAQDDSRFSPWFPLIYPQIQSEEEEG